MSTRTNIQIKSKEDAKIYGKEEAIVIHIYHHCDGYLSGVGIQLLNMLSKTQKFDDSSDIANKLIKDKEDDSFELTLGLHGDEEYFYEIDVDNKTFSASRDHGDPLFICKYDDPEDINRCLKICED